MLSILLFLFPAGFSLKIKDDFFKDEMNTKDYVLTFIKYAVIINFIMFTFLYLYSHGKEANMVVLLDDVSFIFKYFVISTVVSVFVPVVDEYLKKFIDFKITVKKIEDKDVKKNRK